MIPGPCQETSGKRQSRGEKNRCDIRPLPGNRWWRKAGGKQESRAERIGDDAAAVGGEKAEVRSKM